MGPNRRGVHACVACCTPTLRQCNSSRTRLAALAGHPPFMEGSMDKPVKCPYCGGTTYRLLKEPRPSTARTAAGRFHSMQGHNSSRRRQRSRSNRNNRRACVPRRVMRERVGGRPGYHRRRRPVGRKKTRSVKRSVKLSWWPGNLPLGSRCMRFRSIAAGELASIR